jgi:hypothetical protein
MRPVRYQAAGGTGIGAVRPDGSARASRRSATPTLNGCSHRGIRRPGQPRST